MQARLRADEVKTSNKFVGKIASVDVYTNVVTAEQIYFKYETEVAELPDKYVSLDETVEIGAQTSLLYELTINDEPRQIHLHETVSVNDLISLDGVSYIINLDEQITLQEAVSFTTTAIDTFDTFHVELSELIIFDDHLITVNPFEPSVNPEIKMIKSGFLITENPKFELEYYSEDDAVKIDHQEIVNATSIANQVQEDLASTPAELLTILDTNEITTAIQVIETRTAILQLEDQVEQIPDDTQG